MLLACQGSVGRERERQTQARSDASSILASASQTPPQRLQQPERNQYRLVLLSLQPAFHPSSSFTSLLPSPPLAILVPVGASPSTPTPKSSAFHTRRHREQCWRLLHLPQIWPRYQELSIASFEGEAPPCPASPTPPPHTP